MASYTIVYTKTAVKSIQKLTPQIRKRLRSKFEYFISLEEPLSLAKALTRPADAQYRYRIGNYRVLFDVEDKQIIILLVQYRKDIYRK